MFMLCVIGILRAGPGIAQDARMQLETFLARDIGLTSAQLAALARGETLAKLLETRDQRDVAAFGAVRIDVPRSWFITRQSDVPSALRMPSRRVVQVLSDPAVVEDVRELVISADDLEELRACRPNRCTFKLPAADMDVAREVDLSAPDAAARVAAYFRRRVADYANAYRREGNSVMVVYDDRGHVPSSDALAAMLRDSSLAFGLAPSLARLLLDYPRYTLPGSRDVLFYSVDAMPHARPVMRIMHQVLYTPPENPAMTVLAAKQIYANHYLEAGLELMTAVDRADAGAAGAITLIVLRRYRFDHLEDRGPINVRDRVRDALKSNVVADLTRLKRDYEAAWRVSLER
jgi:hypothetical protein